MTNTADETCPTCEGSGKIANDGRGTPWQHWQELPLRSSPAIISGLVRPLECSECGGSGKLPPLVVAAKALASMAMAGGLQNTDAYMVRLWTKIHAVADVLGVRVAVPPEAAKWATDARTADPQAAP